MFTLIKLELFKIFSKPRTYIAYGAILLLVLAIQLAIKIDGQNILDFMTQSLQDSFDFSGNLLNGFLIAFVILNTLFIHVPFLVVLIAADSIAGETSAGTYRLILTRSVSRSQLVFAKFIANIFYSTTLVIILGILSLGLSVIIFGKGDLIVIRTMVNIFAEDDIWWRFMYAFAFGVLSMAMISTLALFFSAFAQNSITPIILTMSVTIAFTVFSSLNFSIFEWIRPFLFTSYLGNWRDFFDYELNMNEIYLSLFALSAHIIILYFATLFYFKRKDIVG
jgi:ABC-2 type transport system permease protein